MHLGLTVFDEGCMLKGYRGIVLYVRRTPRIGQLAAWLGMQVALSI